MQLSAALRKILLHSFRVLAPHSDKIELSGIEEKILSDCQAILGEMMPLFRRGFLFGLWLLEHLCFLFGFGFKKFTHLSPEAQKKYLESWDHSRWVSFREFFKSLRGLILMSFYSDPRVWAYIGYDPLPHLEERIELRQKLLV